MPEKLTPAEFAAQMRKIDEDAGSDREQAHVDADNLMLRVLREQGFTEGADVFCKMRVWYA